MQIRGAGIVAMVWMWAWGNCSYAQQLGAMRYQPPPGYELQEVEGSHVYSLNNQATGQACVIRLYPTMTSTGDARADFDHFWKQIVNQGYGSDAVADVTQTESQGWTYHTAQADILFDSRPFTVTVTVLSGHGTTVPVLGVSNQDKCVATYRTFASQVRPPQPEPQAASVAGSRGASPAMGQPGNGQAAAAGQRTGSSNGQPGEVYTADGWRREVWPDDVRLHQGQVQVRLFYPRPLDYNAAGVANRGPLAQVYWQVLVQPEFELVGELAVPTKTSFDLEMIEHAVGEVRHRSTGQRYHATLLVPASNGDVSPILGLAPSRQALQALFPDHQALANATRYNYFPATMARLQGVWRGGSNSMSAMYNVYTGAYAGTSVAAIGEELTISQGQYAWKSTTVLGQLGTAKTYIETIRGRCQLVDAHNLQFIASNGVVTSCQVGLIAVKGGYLLQVRERKENGSTYVFSRRP